MAFCYVCTAHVGSAPSQHAASAVSCGGHCGEVLRMACEAINQKHKPNQDSKERLIALLRHRRQMSRSREG
jgi:hypothetical protein